MSTTATKSSSSSSSAASLATSAKFRTFAIVFAITAPVLYVACDCLVCRCSRTTRRPTASNLAGRRAVAAKALPCIGMAGWRSILIGCAVLGWLATLLPENVIRKIPLALIWILPILAMIPLAWALMPFWTKG